MERQIVGIDITWKDSTIVGTELDRKAIELLYQIKHVTNDHTVYECYKMGESIRVTYLGESEEDMVELMAYFHAWRNVAALMGVELICL